MSEALLEPSGLRFGLVGGPNSGKTTLFNALTGLRGRVGNYPGVTVERREGSCRVGPEGEREAVVVDLPGTYSLDPLSPDEDVVNRVLASFNAEPTIREVQEAAIELYRAEGFVFVRQEEAQERSNKTVGGGIGRLHFEKDLVAAAS